MTNDAVSVTGFVAIKGDGFDPVTGGFSHILVGKERIAKADLLARLSAIAPGGAASVEPVAYQLLWWNGDRPCTRVQFGNELEPWLADFKPQIVPLYAAPKTAASVELRTAAATLVLHAALGDAVPLDSNSQWRERSFEYGDRILALASPSHIGNGGDGGATTAGKSGEDARSQHADARLRALEEAARVAESYDSDGFDTGADAAASIAIKIRALALGAGER